MQYTYIRTINSHHAQIKHDCSQAGRCEAAICDTYLT